MSVYYPRKKEDIPEEVNSVRAVFLKAHEERLIIPVLTGLQ